MQEKKSFNRINKKPLIWIFALLLVVAIVFGTSCFAFADLSDTAFASNTAITSSEAGEYGGVSANDLWYFASGELNLAAIKTLTDSWKSALVGKTVDPIIIAVVDTGLYGSHDVFAERVSGKRSVFVKDSGGNLMGYNACAAYNKETDKIGNITDNAENGHGTAMMSIIAMMIKELELEDYIKIYPIKACETKKDTKNKEYESFPLLAVAEAINWAADHVGASVINLSLGNYDDKNESWATNTSLKHAVNNAAGKSVLVAAAGNGLENTSQKIVAQDSAKNPFYPAALANVVSVMAHTKTDIKRETSNYGDVYDIIAPGEDIKCATNSGKGTYQELGGTSTSTCFVSMAAALLKLRFTAEEASGGSSVPSASAIARVIRSIDKSTDTFIKYPLTGTSSKSYKKLDIEKLLTDQYSADVLAYSDVTGISLYDKGGMFNKGYVKLYLEQQKSIKLEALLSPDGDTNPDMDKFIKWVLVEYDSYDMSDDVIDTSTVKSKTVIGTGKTLDYTPQKGGEFEIYCEITVGNETYSEYFSFKVEYAKYLGGNVNVALQQPEAFVWDKHSTVTSPVTVYTDNRIIFYLTGLEYVDRTVEVKWYINGDYVGSGYTYDASWLKPGTYEIYGQYGSERFANQTATLVVKPWISKAINIAGIVLTGTGLIGVAVVLIVIKKRRNAAA